MRSSSSRTQKQCDSSCYQTLTVAKNEQFRLPIVTPVRPALVALAGRLVPPAQRFSKPDAGLQANTMPSLPHRHRHNVSVVCSPTVHASTGRHRRPGASLIRFHAIGWYCCNQWRCTGTDKPPARPAREHSSDPTGCNNQSHTKILTFPMARPGTYCHCRAQNLPHRPGVHAGAIICRSYRSQTSLSSVTRSGCSVARLLSSEMSSAKL